MADAFGLLVRRRCVTRIMMGSNLAAWLLPALLLSTVYATDKQIKLEDIEKDNLKADQEAKLEKQFGHQPFPQQLQAYPQQLQAYQQYQSALPPSSYPTPNYQGYQPYQQQYQQQQQQQPSPYQYLQQYLQPSLYQNGFPHAGGNSMAGSAGPYHSAPISPQAFQAYYSQQLSQVPNSHATPQQQQAYVMAYASPAALAAYQQQTATYYQGLGAGAAPIPHHQAANFYYPQQQSQLQAQPSPQSYDFSQQYVPPFQPVSSAKLPPNYPQSTPTASSFPVVQYATPSPLTSNQIYSSNTAEPPTYSSLKHPNPSAASYGQHQQYLQAIVGSTPSPLQTKYQNSPQYLSQNYNTIQSSYYTPKSTYIKATASPPLKVASQGGFLPSNPSAAASGLNYQQYRSTSG